LIGLYSTLAMALYSPSLGRFLSRDSLGTGPAFVFTSNGPRIIGANGPIAPNPSLSQNALNQYIDGMNLYEYVKNNPILLTDPTGGCSSNTSSPCSSALSPAIQKMKDRCDKCNPSNIGACKEDAAKIVNSLIIACEYNVGRGTNNSRDNVGGYLCWDWSRAFSEAGKSIGSNYWEISEGMLDKNNSDYVHYFANFKVKSKCPPQSGTDCSVRIDDGFFSQD